VRTLQNTLSRDQLISKIKAAGVVGEGGAGFPAHVKYDTKVETVIANGCECEPLLYSDQYIMQTCAKSIVTGMKAVMQASGAEQGIIAIKKKYTAISQAFKQILADTGIQIFELDNFYPAGDEQILIHEITGRTVPPLGLPKDQDMVVANVGTLFGVANALEDLPVTQKIVTVTGEVATPAVISVPVGTPVRECIEFCQGASVKDPVVVLGGPMMGKFLTTEQEIDQAVVTKTVGGIILLPRNHPLHQAASLSLETMQIRAATACIQCRICTELCPRYLVGQGFETHRVMRVFAGGSQDLESASQAMMCCECGVCELFACPMGLSPRRINAELKNRFRLGNIQYQGPKEVIPNQSLFRDYRKVPTPRLATKIGIGAYMDIHPAFLGSYSPDQVSIPLSQHIGAPALAVVSPGDTVQKGDCIADIPDKAMGARIHASISGVVQSIDQSIIIKGS